MPPCQPTIPVPARTAAMRPARASFEISDIVTTWTIRSTPAMRSASA